LKRDCCRYIEPQLASLLDAQKQSFALSDRSFFLGSFCLPNLFTFSKLREINKKNQNIFKHKSKLLVLASLRSAIFSKIQTDEYTGVLLQYLDRCNRAVDLCFVFLSRRIRKNWIAAKDEFCVSF
jgi:hypothetical protein